MNASRSGFASRLGLMSCLLMLSLAAVGTAHAQVDTTAIETSFTDTTTAVGNIGPLMLTAVGAGIVFKWVLGFVIS